MPKTEPIMSTSQYIEYEHPLNERLRFFIRLEFMFRQLKRHLNGDSLYDSHVAVSYLLEILNYINQQDVKKEALKELERISAALSPLLKSPKIEKDTLTVILAELNTFRGLFREIAGPIGKSLRDSEFIKVLMHRFAAPGGLSLFDPPVYSYWLRQPSEIRFRDLQEWFNVFENLNNAVSLILRLIRESATPRTMVAHNGVFQQNLDTKTPYQMIIVGLPLDSKYFAEISGGKHRVSIRFMDASTNPRPMQTSNDVEFQLSCCVL